MKSRCDCSLFFQLLSPVCLNFNRDELFIIKNETKGLQVEMISEIIFENEKTLTYIMSITCTCTFILDRIFIHHSLSITLLLGSKSFSMLAIQPVSY